MQNSDLVKYIQQARKSGIGDVQIRESLLQSGWQEVDINEAMNGSPVIVPPVSGSRIIMPKSGVLILIVILAAAAGYAGAAYYMTNFQDLPLWPFEASAPISTPTPTPSPTKTPDPTADWQIYRNQEYGFEFEYPADWTLITGTNNDSTRLADFTISLRSPDTVRGLEAKTIDPAYLNDLFISYFKDGTMWAGIGGSRERVKIGTISLGEIRAEEFLFGGRGQNYAIVIDRFPPLWVLSFETAPAKPDLTVEQNKILATFKIISSTPEASPDPMISWKTFTDSSNRFEVKYPESFNLDYSKEYPSGEYRVFGVNDVGGTEPYLYLSVYAKPERDIDEVAACREAGGGYIRNYYTNEKIEIDGKLYIKCYYDRELQKDQALFVSFNRSGYRWEFLATHYDKYSEVIEQILSTFKFTR